MTIPILALLWFSVPISTKPALVITDVHIGDRGPYRFLVDTGADASVMDPALVSELGLQPQFRVQLVTQHGTHLTRGAKVRGLRLGQTTLPELDVLFHHLPELRHLDPSIRGVLGFNALAHLDVLLSPSTGRLDVGAPRPSGEVIPFAIVNGRMVLKARMGKETLALILDSGASHVVLFRTPAAMAQTSSIASSLSTSDGARSVVPTTWTSDMVFTRRLRVGMLPAAIVPQTGTEVAGLLPASVFKKIFVDRTRQELVVVR